MDRPANRLEEWVDRIMLKIELNSNIKALREAFLPFREQVRDIRSFRQWLSDVEQIRQMKGMKMAGYIIRQSENQVSFLRVKSELEDKISDHFGIHNHLITNGVVEKHGTYRQLLS